MLLQSVRLKAVRGRVKIVAPDSTDEAFGLRQLTEASEKATDTLNTEIRCKQTRAQLKQEVQEEDARNAVWAGRH